MKLGKIKETAKNMIEIGLILRRSEKQLATTSDLDQVGNELLEWCYEIEDLISKEQGRPSIDISDN